MTRRKILIGAAAAVLGVAAVVGIAGHYGILKDDDDDDEDESRRSRRSHKRTTWRSPNRRAPRWLRRRLR